MKGMGESFEAKEHIMLSTASNNTSIHIEH